jgi:hypothetical protein
LIALRKAIIHTSMARRLLPTRSSPDQSLRRLDLGRAFLQSEDIMVLSDSMTHLADLESLVVGEEATPDNPNPHMRYELNANWRHIDFTASRYSESLWSADLLLLGQWICKPNVVANLKQLSLRSTGLQERRSKIDDACFGGRVCTGMHGDRNCPSCRFREFVESVDENEQAGHPSYPAEQLWDPYCYTLDVDDTELVLSEKYLGVADCKLIAIWLSNICRKYAKLRLDGNYLSGSMPHEWDKIDVDVSGVEALGAVIHKLEHLQEVDLSNNLLGSNALLAYAAPVEGGSPLSGGLSVKLGVFRVLDISDNRIDAVGWRNFLDLCTHGDISTTCFGSGVTVVAKRNPILWTTAPSRPTEQDLVAVFPMQESLVKTYTKLADETANDPTPGSGEHISLRKVVADAHADAVAAGDQDSSKTDEASFQVDGMDAHWTDQEVVRVTGTKDDWLKIWKDACSCLTKVRFSGLDISDTGIGSYSREAVQMLAQALRQADCNSAAGCPLTVLTIDSTIDPDEPACYTLSSDSHTVDCECLLGPDDCNLIGEWLKLSSIRQRVRQVHLRTLTRHLTGSSSIGVRGKYYLARAVASRRDDSSEPVAVVKDPSENPSAICDSGFNLSSVEEIQLDIAYTAVMLRSDQLTIPGLRWTLRDLEGLTVGDVPAPGNIDVMPLRFKLGNRPVLSARLNVETA